MIKEEKEVNNKSKKTNKSSKNSKKVKKEQKKENKIEEKVKNKKLSLSLIIIASIIIVLLVINLVFGNSLNSIDKTKDIRKIKKIINEKYDEISCVTEKCNYVVATLGNSIQKTTYVVFNISGKKITQFSINYKKNSERSTKVVGVTNKYIITRTTMDDKYNYSLRNLKGKVKYSTTNTISILNQNNAITKDNEDNYLVISSKGKTKYKNVKSYYIIDDGNYLFINQGQKVILLDGKDNIISKEYDLEKEVKDNENVKFLILKNIKTGNYSYFSTKKGKIIGSEFQSYKKINDEKYEIVDNKKRIYYLGFDGKQEKVTKTENLNKVFSKVKEKIDTKLYYPYAYGIKSTSQENVLVKNIKDNSFGVYNINNKKYKSLLNFNNKASSINISELDGKNSKLIISCTKSNCDKELSLIYDLEKNKIIYKEENNVISSYIQYENDYKVLRYSYLSSNEKLAGKYVLLDSKNKNIFTGENAILIIDQEVNVGKNFTDSSILYSSKENKIINSKKYLATKIKLNGNLLYKYNNSKGNITYLNDKGEKLLKVNSSDYLTYSNSNIIYIKDDSLKVFNVEKEKLKTYKIKNNEQMRDENEQLVSPYRGIILLNNKSKQEVKILNSKTNIIRRMENVVLSEVKVNSDKGIALIIVKKNGKNSDKYGLYIAK